MSYGLSAMITLDEATPAMERLRGYLANARYRPTVGESIVSLIQSHLFAWDQSHPNRLGGKRTNIIAAAGKATHWDDIDSGILVTITNEAIAARYFGAEIRPVNSKFLAIPARAEAHGKSPREFELEAVFPKGRTGPAIGWLVSVTNYQRRLKSGKRAGQLVRASGDAATEGAGSVMFWLVKRARIAAEPDILPTEEAMVEAGIEGVMAGLDRSWEGATNV